MFAPRRRDAGQQGVPVNRTAAEAQVTQQDVTADWGLTVQTRSGLSTFTVAQLRALPQTEHELPVACVEGWTQSARWRGLRVRDLLTAMGAPVDWDLRFTSMERTETTGSWRCRRYTARMG